MIPFLEHQITIGDKIKSVIPGDIYAATIKAIRDENKQGESKLWFIKVDYSILKELEKKYLFAAQPVISELIYTTNMQVVQLKLDVGQWIIIK